MLGSVDADGARLANRQVDSIGDMVDVDSHGDALRQAHPREHRVDLWQALRIRRGVRVGDAAVDAFDVACHFQVWIAHERGTGAGACANVAQARLFEVTGDPIRIGVDHAHLPLPGVGVVAGADGQVGHVAIDGRADFRPLQVDLGLVEGGLGGFDGGLVGLDVGSEDLTLLGGDGAGHDRFAALDIGAL